MVSSGLLRRVALVRTDVSEEPGASFIRVTKQSDVASNSLGSKNVMAGTNPVTASLHCRAESAGNFSSFYSPNINS
jgi:hypothetical protein